MTEADAEIFQAQRGRLFGLAYRMLGSASDAEDMLQEAFLRWNASDAEVVREPTAWLTRIVTNLCLTELASARVRRERYTGPWLPEPILTGAFGGIQGTDTGLGPLETAAQRDSVSMALLLLCEQLTPAERAVFILHEAFGYSYREIGELLERKEASCRQLGHRAAARLKAGLNTTPPDPAEAARWRRLTGLFLTAAAEGDLEGLERLLADDVVSIGDGGGKVPAGMRPVLGRAKVARLVAGLGGLLTPGADLPPAAVKELGGTASMTTSLAEVNGSPAVLMWAGDSLFAVLVPVIEGEQITALYGVTNPDKLAAMSRGASRTGTLPGQ